MKCQVARLGDHVSLLSGFAFKSVNFSDSQGIPLIRIRNVLSGTTDTYFNADYDDKYIVNDGEIIIGMDGEFNRAYWRGGSALLNQRVCKIASNSEKLDDSYLFHFLPSALKIIEDSTPFVTVKHLSAKSIRSIQIPLPPLPEQKRIAAILDKADALRTKRQGALAKLDELTRSIFLEMFGDPNLSPPTEFDKKLGAICTMHSGYAWKSSRFRKEPSGLPIIRIQNVGVDNYSDFAYWPDEYDDRFIVEQNDILLTLSGSFRVERWQGPKGLLNQRIVRLKFNESINQIWILCLLNMIVKNLEHIGRHALVNNIALSDLKQMPIQVPAIALQEQFARRVEKINLVKTSMQSSSVAMETLFSSLQHRAFSGTL